MIHPNFQHTVISFMKINFGYENVSSAILSPLLADCQLVMNKMYAEYR